jgi:transposase
MVSTRIAVDLAKSVFQVAISTVPGRIDEQHRLSRERFQRFFAARGSADVLMEACGTAHHWGRFLEALGHRVWLLPPADVARYRDGNKTDRADTVAILEAGRNEAIDPVPVKTLEQQALNIATPVAFGAYVSDRTARIDTVRGILREFGYAIPQGARTFVARARPALEDPTLSAGLRDELDQALDEIEALRQKARARSSRMEAIGEGMSAVQYLRTIPGIGPLTATALVSFVGEPRRFRSGRHFASYLGLTPRESSSGLKRRLGRISKRGNIYLRMLLTHGARSALLAAHRTEEPDALQLWALRLELRSGHNKATVALANRLARIAWRIWCDQRPYERMSLDGTIGRGGRQPN